MIRDVKDQDTGEDRPVLVIFSVKIDDWKPFDRYQEMGRKSLANREFERVAGPYPAAVFEGPAVDEVVVLRFPSLGAATEWYESKEYQEAVGVRQAASSTQCVVVEEAAP